MDIATPVTSLTTNIVDTLNASLGDVTAITQPSIEVDFKLSAKALRNIYSATKTDLLPFIEKHMLTYEINTKQRMAAFLSSCFIMSSGFRRKAESYSFTACRLYKDCDKVDTPQLANRLVRNGEQEIANYLFSFENGNGGIDSDDGWLYRARTPLQFRGRNSYQSINDDTGIDCVNHPELLEEDENSVIAAMSHWRSEGYNLLADDIKFSNGFELLVKNRANSQTKNYHSNRGVLKIKKKLNNNISCFQDFCEFIEMGMLYL